MPFPFKKNLPTFEEKKNLNINVFELSSNDKTFSLKNYYEEQILLFRDHFRLITNLHNFCWKNENNAHLCRRCLNT